MEGLSSLNLVFYKGERNDKEHKLMKGNKNYMVGLYYIIRLIQQEQQMHL